MRSDAAIQPRQARSRRTQKAILAATESLMEAKPFEKITIAEIAAAAGISVGNFYNRFPDKTALLVTLYDEYAKERTAHLTEAFAPDRWEGQTLQQRADGLIEILVDFFWSRRALIRSYLLYYRANPEAAPDGTADKLREISRAGTRILGEGLPGRPDAEAEAALGLQMVVALCREFILFADDPSKSVLGLERGKLERTLSRMIVAHLRAEDAASVD